MKTITKVLSAALLISAVSCTKTKSVPTSSVDMSTETTYHIGDHHGGGIIFYLDSTKKHGLIAANTDQSTGISW